jgi:putative DNA primase/helicase
VRIFGTNKGTSTNSGGATTGSQSGNNLTDQDLLTKARSARNGTLFCTLYDDGDWQSAGYNSQSEADLALSQILAWWTNGDAARIDALFRASALYRSSKWNRRSYSSGTIAKAIALCGNGGYASTPHSNRARPAQQPQSSARSTATSPSTGDDNPAPTDVEDAEIALSHRFVEQYQGQIRFAHGLGDLIYDARHNCWIEDRKRRIFTWAKFCLVQFCNEIRSKAKRDERAGTVIDWPQVYARIRALTSAKKVAAIVTLAQSHTAVSASPDDFDPDPWLLNTPGGAIDLRDGSIRPTRPEDLFSRCTRVTPQSTSTPVFDHFLAGIMGRDLPVEICQCAGCLGSDGRPAAERQAAHDVEVQRLVDYIIRLLGAALPGFVTLQILVLLVGSGGNGKGCLIRLIEFILDSYTITLAI